jgi:hypothetical protein
MVAWSIIGVQKYTFSLERAKDDEDLLITTLEISFYPSILISEGQKENLQKNAA